MSASKLIRDSIAALPDHLRLPRWAVDGDQIVTLDAADDPDLVVASQYGADDGPAVAALLYTLARPDVAAAVADLLDAIGEDIWDDEVNPAQIISAMGALEAAITRTGGAQ